MKPQMSPRSLELRGNIGIEYRDMKMMFFIFKGKVSIWKDFRLLFWVREMVLKREGGFLKGVA